MDKIVQVLQALQDDIKSLRGEVHNLSDKIDDISDVKQEIAPENTMQQSMQDVVGSEENIPSGQQIEKTIESNAVVSPDAPIAESSGPRKKSLIERFFIWLAKDWPMKIGGFFVIAAVGWFVTYAASEGWISETARVILGYLFAIICIFFGSVRANKEQVQGNVFLIIGIAAMLISTLAGLHFEMFTPVIGLFVMLISVGLVTFISLRQEKLSLTASMVLLGGIIPLLFFNNVDINILFVYLFILTLGTLWIVYFTGWRELTFLALLVIGFYSVVYIAMKAISGGELESLSNLLVAFLFAMVFYIANVLTIIKSEKKSGYDIATALGIGILVLIWILNFAPKELEVILLLISVVLFAGASYFVFVRTGLKSVTAIYGGVTAILFAVATAIQFQGAVLTTAYLFEVSAVIIITLYFAKQAVSQGMRTLLVVLYLFPAYISFMTIVKLFDYLSYSRMDNVVDYIPELFTILAACVTALAVAVSILKLTNTDQKENMTFFRIFAYTGSIFAVAFIWFVTHMFMGNQDLATFISLVIYTVAGVAFYIMGIKNDYGPYKIFGGILFGLVVVRVLLVEFWTMDIIIRIITALVLGALLISTAFIKSSK